MKNLGRMRGGCWKAKMENGQKGMKWKERGEKMDLRK